MKTHNRLVALVLSPLLVGCSFSSIDGNPEGATSEGALSSENGLSSNGLHSLNGLWSLNGLHSLNGLWSLNGVQSLSGLPASDQTSLAAFRTWFNTADGGDIALHDNMMKYVIRCALATAHSISITDSAGAIHTWAGALGLADSWFTSPPTPTQKQWVSACVMAHVNSSFPEPQHIQISLRGTDPSMALTPIERATFKTFDGVFFGDLFASTPKLYASTGDVNYSTKYESLLRDWGRQCAYSPTGCGVFTTEQGKEVCHQVSGDYPFDTCTVGGVTYQPISVYVPDYLSAGGWSVSGGPGRTGSCTGCVDGKAIIGLSNKTDTAYAYTNGWVTVSGNYYLDVRYTSPVAAKLKVKVGDAFAMNGTSQLWDFPATASASTWKAIAVPVAIAAGAEIRLVAPGTAYAAPVIDVVSRRLR